MAEAIDMQDSAGPTLKEERGRSSVEFAYNDLADAETIVSAVRDVGGTGCTLEALAAKLNLAPGGGGFRMKVYSSRSFGGVDISRGRVDLTDLGIRLIDAKHQKAARVEAFLNVQLFKLIYEALKGMQLPPPAAVERMMLQAGVAPKQKERARQVFMRSAKLAGFFDVHPDRLVKPSLHESAAAVVDAPPDNAAFAAAAVAERNRMAHAQAFTPTNDGGIHPAIFGLLRDLPPAGSEISKKRRAALVAAFSSAIEYIYPEPEGNSS